MENLRPHRSRVLLVAGVAALTALTACSPGESSPGDNSTSGGSPSRTDSVTIGVQRPPNSFDPLQSIWGGQYQMYLLPVYETLIRQEPDGSYSPGLATEWGLREGSLTEFELTLRDGVVFSDGTTPVDAAAVAANLDRLSDTVGPHTAELAGVLQSVEAVDDDTVLITLSSPNPALERILSQLLGMIVNPAALDDVDALTITPQGAGPYLLDTSQTIVNDTYVYTKNEHYYAPELYPYETITMKVYADQNAMLTALQSGVAQLGYGAPDNVQAAEGSGLDVATQATNVFHLVLQDRDGELVPALGDARVRQALNYAVDREAILEAVYRGQGQVTEQVFGPNTDGYDPSLEGYYPYDPDRARELLAEAGYGDGFTFSVAVSFPARDGDYAQALAGYFAEIGVTMEIVTLTNSQADASVLREYAGFINGFGGQGAYGDAKVLFLTPGTVFNAFGTENAELTELWNEGTNAATEAERVTAYRALGAAVTEEAWFVPTTAVNAVAYYDADVLGTIEFTPGVTVPLFYELQAD